MKIPFFLFRYFVLKFCRSRTRNFKSQIIYQKYRENTRIEANISWNGINLRFQTNCGLAAQLQLMDHIKPDTMTQYFRVIRYCVLIWVKCLYRIVYTILYVMCIILKSLYVCEEGLFWAVMSLNSIQLSRYQFIQNRL